MLFESDGLGNVASLGGFGSRGTMTLSDQFGGNAITFENVPLLNAVGTGGGSLRVSGAMSSPFVIIDDGSNSATISVGATGGPNPGAINLKAEAMVLENVAGRSGGICFGSAVDPDGRSVQEALEVEGLVSSVQLTNTNPGESVRGIYSKVVGDAQFAYGIHGEASTINGLGIGVRGTSGDANGIGVQGLVFDGSRGVQGVAFNFSGGTATGGNFVAGASSISNYGVFAATTGQGTGVQRAGYFDGSVDVVGSLSKAGRSFKIDHPLDPANKFLYHSFVESPDMMNIYNGNVRLDGDGEAWVTMQDWFEALNMEFRYQLTAIGAPGPRLHVAEEIEGNRFKIAGGVAGSQVSWQVTGVRQDDWAKNNRIAVEVEKTGRERGLYLHPMAAGQPKSAGIGYERLMEIQHSIRRADLFGDDPSSDRK